MSKTTSKVEDTKPWWKYGYVWLLISGPLIVVFAGFYTLYLAISRPDPVIDDNYYQHGIEINKTLDEQRDSMAPANQARNHAATGIKPMHD
ncbi:MAG: FixH family protein [Methylophilaceae bacterium]